MEERKRELKMYFLVMYNISPIQQGIQSLHGSKAYVKKYKGNKRIIKIHDEWDQNFETVVLLNGGTSNNGFGFVPSENLEFPVGDNMPQMIFYFDKTRLGTMELHEKYLIENNIPYAAFHEPDLNNSLSSLCFICDEKVFDWVNYPIFDKWYAVNGGSMDTLLEEDYEEWVEFVGGKINAKLKELIYGKKLA